MAEAQTAHALPGAYKEFFALALEPFLRCLEFRDTGGDFFAFLRAAEFLFGHAYFLLLRSTLSDSHPAAIRVVDWGAIGESAQWDWDVHKA